MKMMRRRFLYEISTGAHMHPSDVKEGKIEIFADKDGLSENEP